MVTNYYTYSLIDTETQKIVKSNVTLSKAEADTLNYAYSLNTKGKLKYVLHDEVLDDEALPLNVFNFEGPI